MICYFSPTGNSEYVAKRLGHCLHDEVLDLFAKLRSHDTSPLTSTKPWVFVTPTYAWRIPKIVYEWLAKVVLSGNQQVYFVMTCGANIGNAGAYLQTLCTQKQWIFKGCAEIVMPENYIALFTTPDLQEAQAIIEHSEPVIDAIAKQIQTGEAFRRTAPSWVDKLESGPVNPLFYSLFVHAKKFHVSDACISCGLCVRKCPLCNIELKAGKPVWGAQCTHCMACISHCPKAAIEYGKHSVGQVRYRCPK